MAGLTVSPRLTVRALAEMLKMPAYEQLRVLYDQKYPKQEPQSFRTPYYQRSLAGIREYFRSANDPRSIAVAKNDLQNIGNLTRRTNNLRVLDQFSSSTVAKRKLEPLPNARYSAMAGSVEIRLSPDLQALENDRPIFLYFNCRSAEISEEIAGLTVEIAHWVLQQSGVTVDVRQIEVFDLFTGKQHKRKSRRPSTVRAIKNNGRVIEALWATV
jgi:hypothetical protein